MWCCGLIFHEEDFKILLAAQAVHIHIGDENPFVNKNWRKFSLLGVDRETELWESLASNMKKFVQGE